MSLTKIDILEDLPIEEDKVNYFFTKNQNLLNKYYKMREESFISTWNLTNFHVGEDSYDKISEILVATYFNECIAGARLIVHPAKSDVKLTFEVDGFDVQHVFTDLNLKEKCYGEISRLAVSSKYKGTSTGKEILRIIGLRGEEIGCDYFIVVCPKSSARFVRQTFNNCGYKATIYPNIKLPDRPTYENIKMYLMVIEL